MSSLLLRICAVDRCSHTLSDEYHRLAQAHHKALFARAAVVLVRLRRRRATRAPVTLLHKRRLALAYGFHSLQKFVSRHLEMASQQEIRRRSSVADRTPLTESVLAARATTTTLASPPDISRSHREASPKFNRVPRACRSSSNSESMPPPPVPRDESSSGRHSRAASSASRHQNRLSLTLPIALPAGEVSRVLQSPVAAVTALPASVPPTPVETPGSVSSPSPSNANEFIIAIAAQERRVLELREELSQAENELARLKKQWASEEVYRKRSSSQRTNSYSSSSNSVSSPDDDALVASRRSVELDRRKLLLQTQNPTTQSRRKVLRGGHTRTLSLLSPVKADIDLHVHEDAKNEANSVLWGERRASQITSPGLVKRASWQPRSQQIQSAAGVPQIVEDFKLGLRAFVEDIRQITVGDEPVSGQPPRPPPPAHQRVGSNNTDQPGDQDTAGPYHATRARRGTASERGSTALTSTQVNKTPEPKGKNGRMKHFSWTPLGFDSIDDTDWSNWDSPISTKSARWSGSTINSSGIDEIESIPEREDEDVAKPAKASATETPPLLSPTLEMLPNVVHRLSPSNLKRTASNLMDEWEKSLLAPEARSGENGV